ncbi:MAG: peptidylprolyl isomerase [Coleofasciculaceae cyanobacterium]
MSQSIIITNEDILQQVKLSCKIPEIVEEIVTLMVIENAVSEAAIKIETEELQQVADQMRLINKLNSAEETWTWLEKHSLSLDEFEEIVYNTVSSRKLANHLFADKVESYFFENQLDYVGAVIYEIVLDDEDLAIELYYAIQEGEVSFYDVAHQYIQDKELSRKCGYRGLVRRHDLKPEISAPIFAASFQELLKPIVTSSGVHLILVEEIIQPQLNDKLRYQIKSDLFAQWLKQQIEEVEVVTSIELNSKVA